MNKVWVELSTVAHLSAETSALRRQRQAYCSRFRLTQSTSELQDNLDCTVRSCLGEANKQAKQGMDDLMVC